MANSSFYAMVAPGAKNGGNTAMMNAIDSAKLPFAFAPKLTYEQTIKWSDLIALTTVAQVDVLTITGTVVFGTYTVTFTNAVTGALITSVSTTVHEDTVTIGGTASDGNYDTLFVTPVPPVRARTVRSTTPATNDNLATQHAADITDLVPSGLAGIVTSASAATNVVTIVYAAGIAAQNLTCTETTATGTITASCASTTTTIAAALEALIQTARATTLAAYVANETTSTNTVTVTYVAGVQVTMSVTFAGAVSGAIATTNTGTVTLGGVGNYFPANVKVDGAIANVSTAFDVASGTPTITMVLGGTFDAGADADGLMTSSSLATAAVLETPSAASFGKHFESAFPPVVVITSDVLFTTLVQGEVSVMIHYTPVPTF